VWLQLDGDGALQQQAYRALRAAILGGALRPGARLPATRALARELGLARNTLLAAYEQLVDEGYCTARRGSGTYVAASLPDEAAPAPRRPRARAAAPLPISAHAERILAEAPRRGVSWGMPRRGLPYDFRYGEPAYADLPLETWWRLLGRRARRASAARLAYGDPAGAPELRRALAEYLRRARGVACTPEQVIVTHGSQQAIDLVARVLVDAGDRVALEEPHYTGFSLALRAFGAELVPVPVDAQGLRTDALEREPDLRGVCVTPSHQFPTGGVLPLERRLALLAWAERARAFVLEDDYDGEFRYEGRPLASLQGLDRAGRVLYLGTASKLLFPALRIGWLVVPEPLVRAFTLAKAYADTGSPQLEQLVLADFIAGGQLERHVRRARVRNAARREALHAAVARHLAGAAELAGTRAGLHGLLLDPGPPRRARGRAPPRLRGARRGDLPRRAVLRAAAAAGGVRPRLRRARRARHRRGNPPAGGRAARALTGPRTPRSRMAIVAPARFWENRSRTSRRRTPRRSRSGGIVRESQHGIRKPIDLKQLEASAPRLAQLATALRGRSRKPWTSPFAASGAKPPTPAPAKRRR
jgi:GntR family transcriptional regulator/MocR family aminotransferase